MTADGPRSLAVVGASGYVGRLLVDRLAGHGHRVTAIGRQRHALPTGPQVTTLSVDVGNADATTDALAGVDAAYYLVHAMAGGKGYAQRDQATASAFATAARRAGVSRMIYLGGLGESDQSDGGLSEHLTSRQEVGEILRTSGTTVVELRAAVILGAGSISFEMLRYLTERLPAMVCPRWVTTHLQPLAQDDLLAYLEEALTVGAGIYEIGAPDLTTYNDMMQIYAAVRGLHRRLVVKIPLLTPSLSARWVDLVTPVDRAVSHALIESLTNEVTVRHPDRTAAAFTVRPRPVADAIAAALSDQAASMAGRLFDLDTGIVDGVYVMRVETPMHGDRMAALGADLARCGGDLHWYGAVWCWRLRIILGRLFGEHLGLHRPSEPRVGATADWWTIERLDDTSLVLGATWFFGDAWLGYRVTASGHDDGTGDARLAQVAAFRPKGVPGFIYWRLLRPIHRSVFQVMAVHRIRRAGMAPPASSMPRADV